MTRYLTRVWKSMDRFSANGNRYNLTVNGNIKAIDIYAWDITTKDISARNIRARNITAEDITAWDITAKKSRRMGHKSKKSRH